MRFALLAGARGVGRVAPNPLVGCAIVDRDGRLLAVGHHRKVGQAHAEIDALAQIADRAKLAGARVYVTLEPCAHEGRTGSCAKALAALPLREVIYAIEDPDPRVSGAGAEILRAAGIAARSLDACAEIDDRDELIAQAEELAEVFLRNVRQQTLFVSLKAAFTLDGQMAMANGESKWITGEAARARARRIRAAHDAVLIGRRTFELDDPRLDVRAEGLEDVRNAAILLDPSGASFARLAGSALMRAREPSRVFAIAGPRAPIAARDAARTAGVTLLEAPTGADGSFEARALLAELWRAGLRSIMVEGGARAYATFARDREFQRLHAFIAPLVLGAREGLSWTKDFGFASLAAATRLRRTRVEALGDDVYLTGLATPPPG